MNWKKRILQIIVGLVSFTLLSLIIFFQINNNKIMQDEISQVRIEQQEAMESMQAQLESMEQDEAMESLHSQLLSIEDSISAVEYEKALRSLQYQITNLRKSISTVEYKKEIESLQSQLSNIENTLSNVEYKKTIKSLQSQLSNIHAAISTIEYDVVSLSSDVTDIDSALEETNKSLKEQQNSTVSVLENFRTDVNKAFAELQKNGIGKIRVGAFASDGLAFDTKSMEAKELFESGDYEKAVQAYNELLKDNPDDLASTVYLISSQYHLNPGDSTEYSKRIKALNEILIDGNVSPNLKKEILHVLGQLYFDMGDWNMAQECYNTLIGLDPDSLDYKYRLGLSYYFDKEYIKAQDHLSLAQKSDPKNSELSYYTALSYFDDNRFDQSIPYFELCMKLPRPVSRTKLQLGIAYQMTGNYKKAIEYLTNYNSNHQSIKSIDHLSQCYAELRKYKSVRSTLKKALSLLSSGSENILTDMYVGICDISFKNKDYEESFKFAEDGYLLTSDPLLQCYKGRSYVGLGEREAARESLEKIVKVFPDTRASQTAKSFLETYELSGENL